MKAKTKCIIFVSLGFLLGFAYLAHSILFAIHVGDNPVIAALLAVIPAMIVVWVFFSLFGVWFFLPPFPPEEGEEKEDSSLTR